jgi:hypothetical protein
MERADMLLPYRGGVKANLYVPVPPKWPAEACKHDQIWIETFQSTKGDKVVVFGVFLKFIELDSSAFQASEHIAQTYAEMRNTEASQ